MENPPPSPKKEGKFSPASSQDDTIDLSKEEEENYLSLKEATNPSRVSNFVDEKIDTKKAKEMDRRKHHTSRKTNKEIHTAQVEKDKEMGFQSTIPCQLANLGNKEGRKGAATDPMKGATQSKSKS